MNKHHQGWKQLHYMMDFYQPGPNYTLLFSFPFSCSTNIIFCSRRNHQVTLVEKENIGWKMVWGMEKILTLENQVKIRWLGRARLNICYGKDTGSGIRKSRLGHSASNTYQEREPHLNIPNHSVISGDMIPVLLCSPTFAVVKFKWGLHWDGAYQPVQALKLESGVCQHSAQHFTQNTLLMGWCNQHFPFHLWHWLTALSVWDPGSLAFCSSPFKEYISPFFPVIPALGTCLPMLATTGFLRV